MFKKNMSQNDHFSLKLNPLSLTICDQTVKVNLYLVDSFISMSWEIKINFFLFPDVQIRDS